MNNSMDRPMSEIDESIESTITKIHENIKEKKYKHIDFDFFQTLFEIMIDIMEIIEEYHKGRAGYIKKQIVSEIGETIVKEYFPDHLQYYQERSGDVIETIIYSYKVFLRLKSIKTSCGFDCLPFCL